MLECHGLLLGPWQPVPEPAGHAASAGAAPGDRSRAVLDLATGERLGFARWKRGLSWPLLRWLARQVVKVYETEDASLLCTVTRCRGPFWRWEVHDADERRVAVLYRWLLLDGAGYRLAFIERAAVGGAGRFLSLQRQELGAFRVGPQGTSLTFAPLLERDPFARMALLGAVLAEG